MNNNDENNNSFDLADLNHNDVINPKIFHLFKNFLTKENKIPFKKENSPTKEIMPDYLDINHEIQRKIHQIQTFYGTDQIFKDMRSENSYVMTIFRKGFRNMFFGPKGIVTRKNLELKKYYKSFESKADLGTKINAGSLDYYDFLSKHSNFFDRLKNSRKKILKISGNFTVTETKLEKLHAAYEEYENKRRKKNEKLKKKFKKKKYYINTSGNITSDSESQNKSKKSILKYNFYNTFTKFPKNAFLLGRVNESEELIKKKNIFLNYTKEAKNYKNNNNIQPYVMTHTLNKVNNDNTNNNFINISTAQNEDNKEKENDNNYTIRRKIKQMTGKQIREEKKKLSNVTTIENKNKKRGSISVPKPFPFRDLIHKHKIPPEEGVAKRRKKNNLSLLMNRTNLYNINHNSNNKIKMFNYLSNKNLETSLFRRRLKNIGIETIKQSLNNKIATMPSNKKVAQQLYEFINNSKKYEVKKKIYIKKVCIKNYLN